MYDDEDVEDKVANAEGVWIVGSGFSSLKELNQAVCSEESIKSDVNHIETKWKIEKIHRQQTDHVHLEVPMLGVVCCQLLDVFYL